MKHLMKMSDLTPDEVAHILDVADELKAQQKAGGTEPLLKGKSVALMFSKNSTRTRTSFEVGVYQLGGLGNYMNAATELQSGRGEPLKDPGHAEIFDPKLAKRVVPVCNLRIHPVVGGGFDGEQAGRELLAGLCLSLGLFGTLTPVLGLEVFQIIRITVLLDELVETTEVLNDLVGAVLAARLHDRLDDAHVGVTLDLDRADEHGKLLDIWLCLYFT
mgnify:CR=1 FL=1